MSVTFNRFAAAATLAIGEAEILRDAGNRQPAMWEAARLYREAATLFRFAAGQLINAGCEAGTGYDPGSEPYAAEAERLDALAREIEGGGE